MRGCCANAASSPWKTAPASTWSATNYPGGYTSYNSLARMHQMSPTFAALEKRIDAHVRTFRAHARFRSHRPQARDDGLLGQRDDAPGGARPAPASAGELSGTYYVRTPRGCSGLKFEDPRLDRFMAVAAAQGARAARKPRVGDAAGRAGQPGVVRELAAPRSGAESHRGRAHLDLVQLLVVLSVSRTPGAKRALPGRESR